jgi:peptidoglycan/xylan/chitin deacetylase (PgdA/CDA1 family)
MKKALVNTALAMSGITALRWQFLPRGLYVFNYHRIGDRRASEYDRAVFSCTRETFERQVAWIKRHFEVVNLERLALQLRRGLPASRPQALITFDDGYIDNYADAFAVLRRENVSGVFFLPTAFIETGRVPWWDEIAWLLRHSRVRRIRLGGADAEFTLTGPDLDRVIRQVLRLVKNRKDMPMADQVDEIRRACGVTEAPGGEGQPLFLSWDQVREMARAGMDIGSHTHTHSILSHLGPAEQRRELADSRDILEARLGQRIIAVSYPVGGKSAYTAETVRLAQQMGYQFGFTFLCRVNPLPLTTPMEIDRLAVEDDKDVTGLRSLVCFPSLA